MELKSGTTAAAAVRAILLIEPYGIEMPAKGGKAHSELDF